MRDLRVGGNARSFSPGDNFSADFTFKTKVKFIARQNQFS